MNFSRCFYTTKNLILYGPPGTGKTYIVYEFIKEFLKNKGKFDFLDYTFSHDEKNLIHKKRYSDEEIKLKYCLIIFDLISKKGVNEFTAKELIPYFNFKYTYNAIWINLTSKLLSFNLIEEVYVDIQRKIFKFTEKGFNFVENGFESES